MVVPLLIGLLFLLFLIILIPIVFIIIYRNGYKKTAIIISLILISLFLRCAFMNSIDSFTYSKKDVKNDLNYLNVKLDDNFTIVENKIYGFPEYLQFTKLKISKTDRNKILKQIVSEKNFKIYDSTTLSISEFQTRKIPNKTSINYLHENIYYREYYEKSKEYTPIEIKISLEKDNDTLKLQRIED